MSYITEKCYACFLRRRDANPANANRESAAVAGSGTVLKSAEVTKLSFHFKVVVAP